MELIYMYIKEYKNLPLRWNGTEVDDNNFIITDQEINFSSNFDVKLVLNKNDEKKDGSELLIDKRTKKFENFYGENISSVKMLVGENGTGKTTLTDLIGLAKVSRSVDYKGINPIDTGIDIIPNLNKKFKSEYLLLFYDMNTESFVIEIVGASREINQGKTSKLNTIINENILNVFEKPYTISPKIVRLKYDFKNHKFELLEDFELSNIYQEHKLIYYSNAHSQRFNREIKHDPDNNNFERIIKNSQISSFSDYLKVIEFLYDKGYETIRKGVINPNHAVVLEYDFSFHSINQDVSDSKYVSSITKFIVKYIKIHHEYKKDFYIRGLMIVFVKSMIESIINNYVAEKKGSMDIYFDSEKNIYSLLNEYNLEQTLDPSFQKMNPKEDRAIGIEGLTGVMQNLANIFTILTKENDLFISTEKEAKPKCIKNLTSIMIEVSKLQQEHLKIKDTYQNAFESVLEKIDLIEEKFFNYNQLIIDKVSLNEMNINEVKQLFNELQSWVDVDDLSPNHIREWFNCKIPYQSDGEGVLISILSQLVSTITLNKNVNSYTIILDEPDQRLHPEWSRRLFNLLLKALDKAKEIKDEQGLKRTISFQLIVSTHSAFMLSDIKQEDVITLRYEKNEVVPKIKQPIIENATIKTFGSNIYDLFKESFMLDNTIGEFAFSKMKSTFEVLSCSNKEFENKCKESKDDISLKLEQAEYLIDEIGEKVYMETYLSALIKRKQLMYSLSDELTSESDSVVEELKTKYESLTKEQKDMFIRTLIGD